MSETDLTRDPRLADVATAALPAWLWAADGSRMLWANAAGAATFAAPDVDTLCRRRFAPRHPLALQVARLAAALPPGGAARLERLRGFGPGIGRMLTCSCRRLVSPDGTAAVLIAAAEPAGPSLPVAAQARLSSDSPASAAATAPAEMSRPAPAAGAPDAAATTLRAPSAASERRQPLRFVWQIDLDGRFSIASADFIALMGPAVAAVLERPWAEIAAELGLDPDGRIAQALASRDTFSGIAVAWPLQGTPERVAVELSGLPMFDRNRSFRGYRGFGVCRDAARLGAIAARRPPFAAGTATGEAAPRQPAAPADRAETPAPPPAATNARPPRTHPGGLAGASLPERPLLTVVPPSVNVVPFRGAPPAAMEKRPALTPLERNAFHEIARALGAPVDADEGAASGTNVPETAELPPGGPERAVLDRIPAGVLICRGDQLLLVNRAVLEWTGYPDLGAIAAAGGLERLLAAPGLAALEPGSPGQSLAIVTRRGEQVPVEGRLFSIPWHDGSALLIVLTRADAHEPVRAAEEAVRAAERRIRAAEAALATSDERLKAAELALRSAQAATRELESVLETATDGVVLVDHDGMILASNRSAEALFGYASHEIANRSFLDLFAPESHRGAHDYLHGLIRQGGASVLNDGREVIGRVQQGGLIPLFMTIGRLTDDKLCIVFRDITQWKRAEEDLTNAKREAEKASSAKSDVLAKVSHEIRTPLNAIIGFAEVMLEERFGPVGNDRYRQYLKDIRTSGEHVMSLVNDLLDLSKIEAGKLELTFVSVSLNDVVQQCVAIMQPQANRERIIIRTSLLPSLPPVVADERSIRQIVLNLLSNSIKFTGAGGQVIVSTALTGHGEAVLRVRDTGVGMSEKEIATALEPFRQVASSRRSGAGTGLGLPLTKVLAEANRASFTIKSAVDAGTLVEIAFPSTRVLAE